MATGQMIVMGILAILFVALPIGGMCFIKKRGGSWFDFLAGAGTFLLFAMVLEAIFNQLLVNLTPLGSVLRGNIWLYALYGGLAAGVFEETGRYVAFRWLLKKHGDRITAIGYGLGHGGCEAMLLLSLTYCSNIVLLLTAGSGGALPQEVQAAAAQLAGMPVSAFLWAGLERISAMALHLSNSALVFAAARRPGKRVFFAVAILLHALCNFIAVVANSFWPIAVTELLVAAFTAAVCCFAVRVYKRTLFRN